jgi:hypothetical protein
LSDIDKHNPAVDCQSCGGLARQRPNTLSQVFIMSLSDVSDLTELSSDEDDVSPSKTTRSTTSKKNTKEYKILGALRPPRTTSYTAKSLYGEASGLPAVPVVHLRLLQTKSSTMRLTLIQNINVVSFLP